MRRSDIPGAFFFGAFTALLLGGSVLSAYETAALSRGWKPVTQRTREAWHQYPRWVAPAIFSAGALLAHLFWGPVDTRADDLES